MGGAAFYRVYGAEQSIDVLGVGIGFQREQAVLNNLQMLFSFGDKEFKNLRIGSTLTVAGDQYNIVAISENEVVLSARLNDKKYTIRQMANK